LNIIQHGWGDVWLDEIPLAKPAPRCWTKIVAKLPGDCVSVSSKRRYASTDLIDQPTRDCVLGRAIACWKAPNGLLERRWGDFHVFFWLNCSKFRVEDFWSLVPAIVVLGSLYWTSGV
jgi:hypothetical protein